LSTVESADGTAIAFTSSGEGPSLILVDGAFCYRGLGPSTPLAARLGERFTTYTYDRRGRGESGDNAPYAVEREIEDLQALIEAAGGSVYLSGISSGAALALEVATQESGVRRLALYETPFVVDDSRPVIPEDIAEQLNALVASDRRGDAVRLFMRHMGAPRIVIAAMRVLPVWGKLTAVAHTLPYDMTILAGRQQGRPLQAEQWAGAAMPALSIVGSKSPAWFHHTMAALAEALPNARFEVLDGQTHNVKAKALAPKLAEFFS
jgi:pimeloyl-ACP methyl ester carboxylesterase